MSSQNITILWHMTTDKIDRPLLSIIVKYTEYFTEYSSSLKTKIIKRCRINQGPTDIVHRLEDTQRQKVLQTFLNLYKILANSSPIVNKWHQNLKPKQALLRIQLSNINFCIEKKCQRLLTANYNISRQHHSRRKLILMLSLNLKTLISPE